MPADVTDYNVRVVDVEGINIQEGPFQKIIILTF